MRAIAVRIALGVALMAGVVACRSPQPVRVAIVAVGGSLSALHEEHQRVYRVSTDALRTRLRDSGGSLRDYDEQVRPIDAAFRLRGDALAGLSSALYAAASITDAVQRGASATEYLPAARDVLAALQRAIELCGPQGLLPGVTVPTQVRQAVGMLTALTGSSNADGGTR